VTAAAGETADPEVAGVTPTATTALPRRPSHRPISYRRHQFPQIAVFIAVVAILVKTFVHELSTMHNVNLWLLYSLAAIGFYWIFGVAGRFAFSHTFMMALGAYTSAFVIRKGYSPWLGILAAIVLTAVIAAVVGAAVHRASEFYFAIATIAVTQVGAIVFLRFDSFTGANGVALGVKPISVFGNTLLLDGDIFWFLLGVLGVVLVLAVLLDRSPLKRRLIAARDNPTVARTAGINVVWLQLMMFVLGSCVAAVAGALIGSWSGVVSNDSFGLDLSVGIFLMVVLGGLGSHWGAVIGAAFYVGLPELLSGISRYQPIIYGGVLLLTIVLVPDGITGALQRLSAKLRGQTVGADRPAPYSATAVLKRVFGARGSDSSQGNRNA
jgi:branched-chain amino acid transport system permease protein